ncbi:MAG: hypothetical protein AB1489_43275, partial [Acidobacteriota bacterium]
DAQSGEILSRTNEPIGGGRFSTFNLNGKRQYASVGPIFDANNLLLQEEDTDGNLIPRVSIETDPVSAMLAISKDGKRAISPSQVEKSLLVFNTESGQVLGSIPLPDFGEFTTLAPNGNRAIVTGGFNNFNRVFLADTNNPTALLPSFADKTKSLSRFNPTKFFEEIPTKPLMPLSPILGQRVSSPLLRTGSMRVFSVKEKRIVTYPNVAPR